MKKYTKLFTALLAVSSLLLLAGCAHYKASRLPNLAEHTYSSETAKNKNVTLNHKVFDKADCKTYLGSKNILKKGYQPIQLTIMNNTDRTYTYSTTSLNLPTVPSKIVAQKVKFSTTGRILGYGAAGSVFFAPIIPAITFIGSCSHPLVAMILIGYTTILATTSAVFYATGITDCKKSAKANKERTVDFSDKAFPLNGTLKPYQSINGLVFVPKKSFNNNFTFTLNDADINKALVLSSVSENINVK